MNQATNVNIVPSYGQRGDLHFSQYDVGRTATINLYAVNEAYTIPLSATVKIHATKPSGLGFDVACTFSGSVVTVVSTETMTAEAGRFPAELHIIDNSDVIGTANFMFVVEPSPHPDGTVDGDAEEVVNEIKALVLQSEGYALGTQDGVPVDNTSPYYHNNAKWFAEHPQSLSEEFKQALLDCFQNVAWIGDDGQDYYDALQSALYPPTELVSISAVYTQSGTVYDTDSLDSLKDDLVVTATYDDSSTAVITTYTLSGTLEVGTSTITVSYGGKTDTFSVTVSPNTAISTVPLTFYGTGQGQSWDYATQTGTLTATGTTSWPGLVLQNLLYKYSDVSTSAVRITAKATISNYDGSGTGILIAPGLYTSADPIDNSAERIQGKTIEAISNNGNFDIDVSWNISELFTGSSLDNYYFGVGVLINGAVGCSCTLTDVDVSLETAISGFPLYAVQQGSHLFTNGDYNGRTITVTNGNHITVYNPNPNSTWGSGSGVSTYAIYSKMTDNGNKADTTNINTPSATLFTLPNGSSVVWEISNMTWDVLAGDSRTHAMATALRSGSTSVVTSGNLTTTDTGITITDTMSSASNITCVFAYVGAGVRTVEFDVSLTVNGVKWI